MRRLFQILPFLFPICFGMLCCGAMFAVSDAFIETRILPKWYAFALGLSLAIAAMAISGREGRDLMRRRFYLFVLIVITACLAQALYGILQFFHILPAFGNLRVTGSFDNPAGLAVLAALGYVVVRRYRKQDTKDPAVRAAGLSLVSIGVFALFSYPLFYPFVWVAGLLSVWIIYGMNAPSGRVVRCVLLFLSIGVVGLTVRNMRYQ